MKFKTKKSINEPVRPSRDAIINKFINTSKKKEPLMKVILAVVDVNLYCIQSVIV